MDSDRRRSITIDENEHRLGTGVAWNVGERMVRATSGEIGANEIDFARSHGLDGTGPTGRVQRD